jgi:hypothetical protein
LLAKLLPIGAKDRKLIQWGYSLRRDNEGWVLIDGERVTKAKQSLIVLLREFSSEVDKWRSVRKHGDQVDLNNNNEPLQIEWNEERRAAACRLYGERQLPYRFDQLPSSVQRDIDREMANFQKQTA